MGNVVFTAILPGYIITYFGYGPMFVLMGSFHLIGWLCVHKFMGAMQKVSETR